MSRIRTALRLTVGAGLGALALAQPASAASLRVDPGEGGNHFRFVSTGDEENRLRVTTAPDGRVSFRDDGATIVPSDPACASVSAHEARCLASAGIALAITLGDRDDQLVVDTSRPAYVSGDGGRDRLTGGPGADRFWAGDGDDVLDGRGGGDLLLGEAGTDTVSYVGRTGAVTVDLNYGGLGTEGQAGEGDTVASDVERVLGGGGADALTGSGGPNLLAGGGGDDTITGGGGSDDVLGGGGRDTLHTRDGVTDRVNCGGQADAVDADAIDTILECEAPSTPAPSASPSPSPTPTPTTPAPGGGSGALSVPAPFGTLVLPAKPVTLKGAHVTLTVACPADMPGGRCTGVVSLERVAKPHHHRHAATSRHQRSRARIGERSYAVRAGRRARVRVRMSRTARRSVARTGSLRAKVFLRRTKRAHRATRVGTLKVRASRRTKRRPGRTS